MKIEKDLRIGNLVVGTGIGNNEVYWISGIGHNMPIGVSKKSTFNPQLVTNLLLDFKDIKLIPITEERLLKAGFEKEFGYPITYIYNDFKICVIEDSFIFHGINGAICPVKYLHNIQNLCYDIDETELSLTL